MPPNPHLLILPSTPHPPPIGTPIHRKNLIPMARQILLQFPRRRIPDLERGILTPAHQQPAVGRETRHVHRGDMPAKSMEEGAGGGVPELDVVVEGRRGDEGAGRGEGDVVDLFLVAEEPGDGFDCCGVAGGSGRRGPEVDGAVVGGGDETFSEGVVDGCGRFEPLFCFGHLLVVG